ncbi:ABC transporter permease [Actinomyces sp. S6-Spd3]|jgi:feS assembly protein sufD|uniref:Fe-S cluster assembly protein SufD n=3 Tax=Actinomycetaceae TaxID=2049 RepID=UPI00050F8F3D|nr:MULTISPECIES: Fe-S cluster assembly protein SufD [Actinomyces]KGE99514.1 ABC transporter permease [Actinomyces sp. S6-Spd3]MBF0948872.1 Fe-S cluster assembly protein SufD [Actinomyces sp.]
MTTQETMARPHSHGAGAPVAHSSRGDRPTSFSLSDIAVPHGREEDWRFTPMRRIEKLFETQNFESESLGVRIDAPEEVLVEEVTRDDQRLGSVLAPGDRTSVVAWNAFTSAQIVTVPKKTELSAPIMIDIDGDEATRVQHLALRVESQSVATIVMNHRGGGHGALNQTVEIEAGDASDLTIVSIQEWDDEFLHASNHRIAIGRDAKVRHIIVTLGGDLVRICSDTDYRGPGGELTMLGLYFVDSGQHLEHRVFVDHSQPNCYSRVTYKGALQGKDAHSVWIGDCLIREAADGTDTYELNRNLVLSEGAKADSVPNLEIENGEIIGAGHASATGRFDDEQLFYLMSRGIAEADARRLVVRGFFAELIEQIGVPQVQEHLMNAIEKELERAALGA